MRAKQDKLPQQINIPPRETPQQSAPATAMTSPAEDYSYDEYEDMADQIETYYVGEDGH